MTETKDNYPQEEENTIGEDKLSPEEKERLIGELTQLFMKLFYDDSEDDTRLLIESLLRKGLWKQSPSHYATVIEKAQYIFNYNIMCSMIYDDPRLKQPSKHLFHSDLENMMWCIAHYSFVGIRCIIQGN